MNAMTETELREMETPWPKTQEELNEIITALANRTHDYGTCVYAMSLAAIASFNFMASHLGCTGFQASMADLDFIKRSRHMKGPFRIADYSNLLYPQYQDEEHFPSRETLLEQHKDWLREEAKKCLAENDIVHPNVAAWWKKLAEAPETP